MERIETLNLLKKIIEAIGYFELKTHDREWSNEFGEGQVNDIHKAENLDDIHTYKMCIDRLNERFTKYTNTLK